MSKQANKTLIGGFVLGAAAIAVIGILIFGGGRWMTEHEQFVLFFEGSVKGLNIGAPVQLKGVTMGEIRDIKLVADSDTMKFYTQVVIEVSPDKILWTGNEKFNQAASGMDVYKMAESMIRKGLRAKLEYISFVTGLLQVSFDFYPDTDIRITGIETDYKELPTLPSDLEAITERLEKIPFSDLVDETLSAIKGINKLVNSEKAKEMLAGSSQTIRDIGMLARRIDSQVIPLSSELTKTMKDTRQLLGSLNRKVDPVGDEILTALKSASATLDQLSKVSTELYQLMEKDSELQYNLHEVLSEAAAAAKSIRLFTDYLDQHPEALIQGKTGGK